MNDIPKPKPYSNPNPLNSRQKQFCINYASGMTQSQAYIKAGYPVDPSIGSASDCASRLMQFNASVKAYYNHLIERKEKLTLARITETIMSSQERKSRLSEIARARLAEFLSPDGQPVLTKETPNNAAAKEFSHRVKHDRDGNPVITSNIKLVDAIEAIRELNRMEGSYAPSKHLIAQDTRIRIEFVKRHKDDARLP